MGVFDIFSTADQQKAAQDQIAGLNAGYSQLSDLFSQGRGALNTNYAAGLAPFTSQFNAGQAGQNQLMQLLGIGGTGGGGGGGQPPNPPAGGGMGSPVGGAGQPPNPPAGGGMGSPVGGAPAGGAGGNIQNILSSLPGYQFALNQGAQNVLRNQGATGQLNSGATNLDLQNQGIGQASQNYFNYANQLMPFMNTANTAAAGIGNLYSGLGNQLNSSLINQGNAAYGTQAGIGNANAQADLAGLTQSGNIIGAGLGLLGGAAGFFSDERTKDDIEPVGELFDGQPVFRYRYKGDPRHQIGLIAQEVEEREPGAVIHNFAGSGLKGVNYRRATDMAAELGRLMKAA